MTFDDNGHHNTFGFGFLSPEGIVNALNPSITDADPNEKPEDEEGGCRAVGGVAWPVLLLMVLVCRRLRGIASAV